MRCLSYQRGFTLPELMIVVANVGILAALSTYGVRRYLASSKTAEALANVGGIGRAVHAAATRETMSGELLGVGATSTDEGSKSTGSTSGGGKSGGGKSGAGNSGNSGNGATVTWSVPGLCMSADPVPSSMNSVAGRKYQPNNASGSDYSTGDKYTGWRCLGFSIDSPQYYQYRYKVGGPPVNVTLPHGGAPPGLDQDHTWSASAQGDLDGDGVTSWFVMMGYITDKKEIVAAPGIGTENPDE